MTKQSRLTEGDIRKDRDGFRCPTCGMHYGTPSEALACCSRLREFEDVVLSDVPVKQGSYHSRQPARHRSAKPTVYWEVPSTIPNDAVAATPLLDERLLRFAPFADATVVTVIRALLKEGGGRRDTAYAVAKKRWLATITITQWHECMSGLALSGIIVNTGRRHNH